MKLEISIVVEAVLGDGSEVWIGTSYGLLIPAGADAAEEIQRMEKRFRRGVSLPHEEPQANPPTVFAVVFGNYEPTEIDGLYWKQADAEKRRDELGGMWKVHEMEVNGSWQNGGKIKISAS